MPYEMKKKRRLPRSIRAPGRSGAAKDQVDRSGYFGRNPARIEPTLAAIRLLWHRYPDQRLGQLLLNVLSIRGGGDDLFYVEDDVLTGWVQEGLGLTAIRRNALDD